MAESPVIYLLKSVVRGRSNRTARVSQPGRRGFVQRLAGGRIIVRRARPARISEAALKAHLVEIKKAVAAQLVEVTTLAGAVVDLETFEAAPLSPVSPVPNPPLDSAKNDKNQNIGYEVPPTPEGTTEGSPEPELFADNALHSEEPVDDSGEETEDHEPEPHVEGSTTPPHQSRKGKKGRR